MKEGVPAISSPPRIKRLVHFGNRVGKTGVIDYTFSADERDDDTQCNVVSGRAEGQGGSVSSLRLPMSFEEEVDEEACIGGGCYYNMSRPHGGMPSSKLSYQQRHTMKATGGCDSSSSSIDICRKCHPFPFIIMLCLLFLFGIGELLRKVSRTQGGVD